MSQSESSGIVTIHLEGKLLAPWVEELRAMVEENAGGRQLRLDLAAMTYVDAAGAELLTGLRSRGVEIVASSAFVAELLEAHG